MASSVAELAALGKLLEEHRSRLVAMVERRLDPALRRADQLMRVLNHAPGSSERRSSLRRSLRKG